MRQMILDLIGTVLQVGTIGCSLIAAQLLTRKTTERWGYLVMFVSLPVYAALEAYYKEWLYFALNPIYIYLYWRALCVHWRKDDMAKYKRTGSKKGLVRKLVDKVRSLKKGYVAK